jgi:hypothetical protein
MSAPVYACGYLLTFTDGGEPEEQILHVGTLDECKRLLDAVPAIAYSGDRPGATARMMIVLVPSACPNCDDLDPGPAKEGRKP